MINLERIKQELILKEQITLNGAQLNTAWKYAYYNPAKKNANGDIVIRPQVAPIVGLFLLLGLLIFGGLHNKLIFVLTIPVIPAIIYQYRIYKTSHIIFNHTGITLLNKTYLWENYIGAYIFFTPTPKKALLPAAIILIKPNGRYDSLNFRYDIYTIGTAIRDCQPDNYKILPTFVA